MKKHPLNRNTFIITVFASLFIGSLLFLFLTVLVGSSIVRIEYSNQGALSGY